MIGIFGLLLVAMVLVVKFCKKTFKIVLSILIILATLYCVIISIDINRVESFREPIFNIGWYEETGLIEYKGLGYRTIVKYGYTANNEKKISSIEMYMFDKCIAGAIAETNKDTYNSNTTAPYIPSGLNVANGNEVNIPAESIEYNRDIKNVTIEVLEDTITNKSLEILITDNNEDYYGWGVDFKVQKKVNREWKNLEYVSDDLVWNSIAYLPNEDNQIKQKIDIEKYYGKLGNGTYRVAKSVYDKGYIDIYSNEFEIK